MKRMYAVKAVQNAKGQWGPKTSQILQPDVDYDPTVDKLGFIAPLQDPQTGALLNNFFFLLADLRDHTKLLADVDHTPLPDFAPDGKWGAIGQAVRAAFKARLSLLGFSAADVQAIDGKDGYREVIDAIIQKLQAPLSLNNLEANVTP